LPPEEHDLGMVWIETQCAAVPKDPQDELLIRWEKIETPFLPFPPAHMQLTGWRDPFVFSYNTESVNPAGLTFSPFMEHRMLIGSGIKGKGGTALIYKSSSLTEGWSYEGMLCEGTIEDSGVVWECPLLVPLLPVPKKLRPFRQDDPPRWLLGSSVVSAPRSSLTSTEGRRRKKSHSGRFADTLPKNKTILPLQQHSPNPKSPANMSTRSFVELDDFEFSSGPSTPPEEVTLWPQPSSHSLATTSQARGADGDFGGNASPPQVTSLAKDLERLATLEHWHDDDGEDEEDRFAKAHARVPVLQVKTQTRYQSTNPVSTLSPSTEEDIHTYSAQNSAVQSRQWHFFTVSPDAPTNPVLYWTGFVEDPEDQPFGIEMDESNTNNGGGPRFVMETAKGPYRLDLGDILYAPNVCRDDSGRWLLWGWLQERRKMGTYNYAGCLSTPRVLHVTDEGRLIQAPAPEIATLRQDGRRYQGSQVMLYPDALVPLPSVGGERLDFECTFDRGSASAVGILFRSHEAEADGDAALVYDWDRNQLEVIFNVPSHWRPSFEGEEASFGLGGEPIDPGVLLCTPRYPPSRTTSFSNLGSSFRHDQDLFPLIPSPVSKESTHSGEPEFAFGSVDMDHNYFQGGMSVPVPGRGLLKRTGSSLSQCLQRSASSSFGGFQNIQNSAPVDTGISLLSRAMSSLNRLVPEGGEVPSSPSASLPPSDMAQKMEDLSQLLETLAAPMRGVEDTKDKDQDKEIQKEESEVKEEEDIQKEPKRRVGGPLLMRPSDLLHLRVLVDHSCIEVFTGTGEVLSTRIYRGKSPDEEQSGIDFMAFGGTAVLERVFAYEVGSAWAEFERGEVVKHAVAEHAVAEHAVAEQFQDSFPEPGLSSSAADRANEFFDEILSGMSPTVVTAGGN
jgi:sucrose-6-phosphate hydrolase SacC (GH32 family)